jgi:DNA-directed RNA polymerase specialized sigma24 family protein
MDNETPDWFAMMVTCRKVVGGFHKIPATVREELAMEAVARTLEAVEARKPVSFACRVARNLAVDWLRRRREVSLEVEVAGPPPSTLRRLDAERAVQLLERAPEAYQRTLAHLYLWEGEVDELIRCEVGEREEIGDTRWRRARDLVYKRRARGLRWLRARLEEADAA